ncbi:hypothetical protein BH10PLA1_BH10PLA1_01740 [soil metagenome]
MTIADNPSPETAPLAPDTSSMAVDPIGPTVPLEPVSSDLLVGFEPRKPYARLFLLSFFLLFFELSCIRWFGSTVVFLTFFTNIVLIATFLGMSVGLMTASRKVNFIQWTLPLAALACALSSTLLYLYNHYPQLVIAVGNQKSPAAIYFGTEYKDADLGKTVVVPIAAIAGLFFTLISLTFVGLGQEMGRAFDALPNRIVAYTVDILGSLMGIAFFAALSYSWSSPMVWFSIAAVMMIYFVIRWSGLQSFSVVILLCFVGYGTFVDDLGSSVTWSPYYKIAYNSGKRGISTNNISHQNMEEFNTDERTYPLVHSLNRDAGFDPFKHVMIIGAGSGNDVQAARMGGAESIDAVEIDPAIQFIGSQDHPGIGTTAHPIDQPYSDARVKFQNTDGRQWLKRHAAAVSGDHPTDEKYDLEVYALVDSLVLHSSYSSLRLESFLFTEEAFKDVAANLKPGGVFAMYNFYRQGWVIGRLYTIAKKVFNCEPIVLPLNPTDKIHADDNEANNITFLLVGLPEADGTPNKRIEGIRAKFKALASPTAPTGKFWLSRHDSVARSINGFSTTQPAVPMNTPEQIAAASLNQWFEFSPAEVEAAADDNTLPSDDWPQLYLRERKLPKEVIESMEVIGALALVILIAVSPKKAIGPSGRMFFLGAGFMLLETKGIVHMSLLFGATWITNSVVFFAILVMVLLSNLFVLAVKPKKLWPYYLLLFATLAVNAIVPMSKFLELSGVMRPIVSCAVVFIPVFFAGVIFGSSFAARTRPDADLGWNIAGIIVGALAENFSVVIGFKYLILVAIGFYLLSMQFVRRRLPAVVPLPA